MLQQLINHSPDLKRLADAGYEMETIGGQYLLVHHIPYVTSSKVIQYGTFVTNLNLAAPSVTARPDHTVYFVGETPCDSAGVPLTAIINNSQPQHLTGGLLVNHYFSSKPVCGYYPDYYEKIRTYAEILGAQARTIDKEATAKPYKQKNTSHESTTLQIS